MRCIECDNCKKVIRDTICCHKLGFGYGSIFDEDEWDFCSDECLQEYINKKMKLQKQTELRGK